jgi:hypothetical protein
MRRGPVGPGRAHGRGLLARFYPAWPASDQVHRAPTRTAKPPPPLGTGEARRTRPSRTHTHPTRRCGDLWRRPRPEKSTRKSPGRLTSLPAPQRPRRPMPDLRRPRPRRPRDRRRVPGQRRGLPSDAGRGAALLARPQARGRRRPRERSLRSDLGPGRVASRSRRRQLPARESFDWPAAPEARY